MATPGMSASASRLPASAPNPGSPSTRRAMCKCPAWNARASPSFAAASASSCSNSSIRSSACTS
eukprot:scaffold36761_cov31-Tisochrysis_lutea.AAC.3